MNFSEQTHIDHVEYPKALLTKSDDMLRFIIGDCKEALDALPGSHNAGYYADEICYCGMDLKKRADRSAKQLGQFRRALLGG